MRLLLLSSVLLLTSCGFKPAVSWSRLDGPVDVVSVQPHSTVERELKSLIQLSLASLDDVDATGEIRRIELAELDTNTQIISVDSTGRPAEYRLELTQDVTFTIGEMVYQEQFSQVGEYVFDVRDILAYKQQLQQLEQRMSHRISQQIMFAFASRLQVSDVN